VIKLIAFFVACRFLRPLVTIAIIATLAVLLLSTRHTGGQGSDAVRQLQHEARPLEQLLQDTLRKAIGP
jgi:hypothetical protein